MDLPDFESVQMLCVVFRELLKPRISTESSADYNPGNPGKDFLLNLC
jgi:hypothetical protein